MRSMTGFGRAAVAKEGYSITVELKTVNNRFLDINLRLPAELQAVEAVIKKRISDRLKRGRVDVNLQYERNHASEFELNRPLIAGFLDAMKTLKDEFGLAGEPDINVIARLPNVITQRKEEPEAAFLGDLHEIFSLALDDLEVMRSVEGNMLRTELLERLAEIERRLPAIEEKASAVADEYAARLTKRLSEMLARGEMQGDLDQARIAQEAAFLADRADISEEIARLKGHITHFRSIIDDDKDVGKRLDFLTQELNREANTIASKTNNMVVKENALAIKSEIEKIREQVQNVE
jgi:uncharacterized protein (TIGR00255 family)